MEKKKKENHGIGLTHKIAIIALTAAVPVEGQREGGLEPTKQNVLDYLPEVVQVEKGNGDSQQLELRECGDKVRGGGNDGKKAWKTQKKVGSRQKDKNKTKRNKTNTQ